MQRSTRPRGTRRRRKRKSKSQLKSDLYQTVYLSIIHKKKSQIILSHSNHCCSNHISMILSAPSFQLLFTNSTIDSFSPTTSWTSLAIYSMARSCLDFFRGLGTSVFGDSTTSIFYSTLEGISMISTLDSISVEGSVSITTLTDSGTFTTSESLMILESFQHLV